MCYGIVRDKMFSVIQLIDVNRLCTDDKIRRAIHSVISVSSASNNDMRILHIDINDTHIIILSHKIICYFATCSGNIVKLFRMHNGRVIMGRARRRNQRTTGKRNCAVTTRIFIVRT